jgi:hypothetical protein
MNAIIENLYKNRPNYCHVLEVGTLEELEEIILSLHQEFTEDFNNYSDKDILDFFNTINIMYYTEEEENEEEEHKIDSFNIESFINAHCN